MLAVSAQPLVAMGKATMNIKTVGLSCEGALALQSCDGFKDAMVRAYPTYTFVQPADASTELNIVLRMVKLSERGLRGQLLWTGAKTGQGPELMSGISDSTIRQSQLNSLVKSLIKQSDIPL